MLKLKPVRIKICAKCSNFYIHLFSQIGLQNKSCLSKRTLPNIFYSIIFCRNFDFDQGGLIFKLKSAKSDNTQDPKKYFSRLPTCYFNTFNHLNIYFRFFGVFSSPLYCTPGPSYMNSAKLKGRMFLVAYTQGTFLITKVFEQQRVGTILEHVLGGT